MRERPDNYTFLTKGPVGKVILTMAGPTVLSMLITSIYNIVATFYVGRINTQATAAVGVVFPVMAAVQAFGFFFGQGSGTYISRKLGAKEHEDAVKMASTAISGSFLCGVLTMLLCLVFLEPLSVALGSTPTILPYTKDFLGIIIIGIPFMTTSLTMNNQMRFQGNAAYAMIGILTGALLSIILMPVFAFTLGMGIKGAAWGTVIGEISGFAILYAMTFYGGSIRLKIKNISLKKEYFAEIIKGGTPSLSRQALASIATLLLNIAAASYGDAAIAGMSIVGRISFVVFAIVIGIGQGFQPFCGFNYGAKNYDRVKKGYWFCLKIGIAFLIVVSLPGFIFADLIVDLLRHDPAVVAVGTVALRWQIITYCLVCIITVSNMTLQTSGRSLTANILAASRNGIFFIPLILILPSLFGLLGVEMCQAVADVFSFIIAIPLMTRYFKSISR